LDRIISKLKLTYGKVGVAGEDTYIVKESEYGDVLVYRGSEIAGRIRDVYEDKSCEYYFGVIETEKMTVVIVMEEVVGHNRHKYRVAKSMYIAINGVDSGELEEIGNIDSYCVCEGVEFLLGAFYIVGDYCVVLKEVAGATVAAVENGKLIVNEVKYMIVTSVESVGEVEHGVIDITWADMQKSLRREIEEKDLKAYRLKCLEEGSKSWFVFPETRVLGKNALLYGIDDMKTVEFV
jgi:hypothetical protein